MSVLLDTSAVIAILDNNDRYHIGAANTWKSLVASDEQIIMTGYTMVETYGILQARYGLSGMQVFMNLIPAVEIRWPSDLTHNAALAEVFRGSANGKGPSLVDCVTLEIGRSEGITDIFAYDRHFANRGFNIIG